MCILNEVNTYDELLGSVNIIISLPFESTAPKLISRPGVNLSSLHSSSQQERHMGSFSHMHHVKKTKTKTNYNAWPSKQAGKKNSMAAFGSLLTVWTEPYEWTGSGVNNSFHTLKMLQSAPRKTLNHLFIFVLARGFTSRPCGAWAKSTCMCMCVSI